MSQRIDEDAPHTPDEVSAPTGKDQPETDVTKTDDDGAQPTQTPAEIVERGRGHIYSTPEMISEQDIATSLWGVAKRVADTEFVPSAMRGKAEKVFACILAGRALNVDAMTSLREISVIDGKPYFSAELRLGLARKAGHIITGTADSRKATVKGTRADTGEEMEMTYTLDDAVAEGLVSLDGAGNAIARSKAGNPLPWERYTQSMLWARAVSRLVDRLFPDVLIGDAL